MVLSFNRVGVLERERERERERDRETHGYVGDN